MRNASNVASNFNSTPSQVLCTVALLSCFAPLPAFAGATFMGLGFLPGGQGSYPADVSADGSTVVGDADTGFYGHAFRWTALTGMQMLGELPGGRQSRATDVSDDGTVVIGWAEYDPDINWGRGFRWTAATGMAALDSSPDTYFGPYGISGDGKVIVGYRSVPDIENAVEAARWTVDKGVEGLGFLPNGSMHTVAYATNTDGSVIVGDGNAANGYPAFRWTEATGIQTLGPLGENPSSVALAVSADGSVIVGYAVNAFYPTFRWTAPDSGQFNGHYETPDTGAVDVSADGKVIVLHPASRWTEGGGMRDIPTLLSEVYGLNLTGWNIYEATAISADGTTFVGSGLNPQGGYEAWYAYIPREIPAAGSLKIEAEMGVQLKWQPPVFDPEGDALTCRLLSQPTNGSATIASNCGSGTYKSKNGFVGTDSFTYITNDGRYDSNIATVTLEVNEAGPDLVCMNQFPISQFSQTGKQGTLSITFTGNITSRTNKEVKVCPGTTLSYTASSTKDLVKCKVKNSLTSGSGTLRIRDHLKCTDKPGGKDKVQFKVKSGITK